ncbi:MAG: hypothetical protein ABID61_05865 [Candidatus Micrarchaeota archaeon]
MVLKFSALPPERKQEMLRLVERWHGISHEPKNRPESRILIDSLKLLATAGARHAFLRRASHDTQDEKDILQIAFLTGENYQGKGALGIDDAQMLLDLVREVTRLVPIPPNLTNTAIMRAAQAFLHQIPTHEERDYLWDQLMPALMNLDPAVFQGSLF